MYRNFCPAATCESSRQNLRVGSSLPRVSRIVATCKHHLAVCLRASFGNFSSGTSVPLKIRVRVHDVLFASFIHSIEWIADCRFIALLRITGIRMVSIYLSNIHDEDGFYAGIIHKLNATIQKYDKLQSRSPRRRLGFMPCLQPRACG